MILQISLGLLLLALTAHGVENPRGAATPWTTYEAEQMATTGEKLGPRFDANTVESEASQQQCVKLAADQFVEFKACAVANALVVRYSLPDATNGGGQDSSLALFQNGRLAKTISITSRFSWLYGKYPFSNKPDAGKARNVFDEVRVKDLAIAPGDTLRVQKQRDGAEFCIVDFLDTERTPAPLAAPEHSLSATDPRFHAAGDGLVDDTDALRKCITVAVAENKTVWLPAGTYKVTGDVNLPKSAKIQGAGLWHTTLVGDVASYGDARKRVRLVGGGDDIHLADFAIVGKLDYRNDVEPNDGITGCFGSNSTISRIWIEHTKTGIWVCNSSNLVVDGCRFRDTIADGVNFYVGMLNSTVKNCAARGTGDDGFAIWPAAHMPQDFKPGGNLITHCTAQFPFLANGAAIYGGESNRIENCRFTDIAVGCGVLISSTFPTADKARGIDNNFSGTTVVSGCELLRCGGYDHEWGWRAALQVCQDRRPISGLDLHDLDIQDSISDGFGVVSLGSVRGEDTLTRTRMNNVNITGGGHGTSGQHDLSRGVIHPGLLSGSTR